MENIEQNLEWLLREDVLSPAMYSFEEVRELLKLYKKQIGKRELKKSIDKAYKDLEDL